jgi:hypothetical protein
MRLATTLVALGWIALAGPARAQDVPSYRIDVRVEPALATIDCRVEIDAPRAPSFFLSRDLTVRGILADGRPAEFEETPAAGAAALRAITVKGAVPARLRVEYSGRILAHTYPPILSQVNGVGPGRVELAGYVGWYPRFKAAGGFAFRLRVDVPSGFTVTANGSAAGSGPSPEGRSVTSWVSGEPTSDVVVLAAPGLRQVAATRPGLTVEILSARLPQDYLDSMKDDVAAAADALAQAIGAPPPGRLVRVAYSPRAGWGYVRRPLIVVSEDGALEGRADALGRARDLRYVVHEIAHYWWHTADADTPDDWINEGLSEYGALRACETLVGPEFAARLVEEYEQRSASSPTTYAIAETPGDSPDREVNRYARPVLLLDDARQRHGDETMTRFVRALHVRFSRAGGATTAAFLEEAEATLGPDAKDRFAAALYRKDWSEAAPRTDVAQAGAFLGTWTGSLTQAGVTNRVVLHLLAKDGVLAAALDSPDQGAAAIPVPTVHASGRTLTFGVGSFGIAFEGRLGDGGQAIEGEWTQGGRAFPLKLVNDRSRQPGPHRGESGQAPQPSPRRD